MIGFQMQMQLICIWKPDVVCCIFERNPMIDVILDTLLDVVKLLPFLFLTYLAMEYLEHKTGNKAETIVKNAGRFGPVIGGALGIVPQCGFSAAAASYTYSGASFPAKEFLLFSLLVFAYVFSVLAASAGTLKLSKSIQNCIRVNKALKTELFRYQFIFILIVLLLIVIGYFALK